MITTRVSAATAEINKMVVRCFYEKAWNSREVGVTEITHSDNWQGHYGLPAGSPIVGRLSLVRRMRGLFQAMPELKIEVKEVVSVSDRVFVRFVLTGGGLGRERTHGFAVHRLEHGRIVDDHVVNETLSLAPQDDSPQPKFLPRLSRVSRVARQSASRTGDQRRRSRQTQAA